MIQGYNKIRKLISESTPNNFTITTVRISDISLSTEKFFDNNFRGAIITESASDLYGYVETSPDGIAYFFKVLLNEVFGDSVVRVSMQKHENSFQMITKWRQFRDISEFAREELEKTARLSGFDIAFSQSGNECEATLTLKIKTAKILSVYAISEFKMHTAYVRVFFS